MARAADPETWRNAVRDQFDRPPADTLSALRARAADAQALEKQPVNSLLLISMMLVEADDRPTAAAVLQVATRHFPDNFWICLLRGRLTIYGAPNPDPAEAARLSTAAVAQRPKSPFARINRALALQMEKKFDDATHDLAIAACRDAIRLAPDKTQSQLGLDNVLELAKKPDGAISSYREAVRLAPGNVQAHSYRAVALSRHGKYDQAIVAYDDVIRIAPGKGDAELGPGYALRETGRLEEAVASFREAIRLAPANGQAQFYLGTALFRHGKHDEAIVAYQEAIRLAPDNPDVRLSLAYSLQNKGENDEAVASVREAIRLKPDDAHFHCCFGYSLQTQGNVDDAIVSYREAVRSSPIMPKPTITSVAPSKNRGSLTRLKKPMKRQDGSNRISAKNLESSEVHRELRPVRWASPRFIEAWRHPTNRYHEYANPTQDARTTRE